MFKIFMMIMCFFTALAQGNETPQCSEDPGFQEQEEFWPPDMIPHPTPPGSGPEDEAPGRGIA